MTNSPQKPTVLVTGASGFIALHCVLQLLEQGYRVRGTLRTPSREAKLREILSTRVDVGGLEFATADLMKDEGWDEAVTGCDYVLHVASPYPSGPPKHEDDLIIPAREGTLRVLKAAAAQEVKRVVLTSSIAAIMHGHPNYQKTFDESDWTNVDGDIEAYPKSKTLAERAAWDFIQQSGSTMELAVINPGGVFGPLLDDSRDITSIVLVKKLMRREYPGCVDLNFSMVDVRDVAAAHLVAMTSPGAAGKRFLLHAETCSMADVALILHQHFADKGYKIPYRKIPNFLTYLVAIFDPTARTVVKGLGRPLHVSNARLRNELGIQPIGAEAMVVAMAESLIALGMV